MYSSDAAGPAVNSVLISGAEEAILVDGQFMLADAEAVIAMVQASGKTLTTIFVTHAHPDHYLGLLPIQEAFPDAKVVSTASVVADYDAAAQATFDSLKPQLGPAIADGITPLVAVSGDALELEGHTIRILEIPEPGESVHAAALVLEAESTLIAGDLLYNDVHLVLSECGAEGWIENLNTTIQPLAMERIFPGHGAVTTPEIIATDIDYIEQVTSIMDAAATPEEATAQIQAAYPDYMSEFLLGFSVTNYFANCKQP
ncbi:Metallo-beta-lactamase superfamily protein [Chondromyces apiculatus DSM 436]|uniref:Metallo-beta-lactamase superfamily protein n=2 Tax=Chondromyces apiculatus TaxID=51 RepID=A0A017T3L2_9BACT|nr:Metallo-beta-lactamase superfamily protein [Chondromyces apiculatus DSM 436]